MEQAKGKSEGSSRWGANGGEKNVVGEYENGKSGSPKGKKERQRGEGKGTSGNPGEYKTSLLREGRVL